MKKFKLTFLFCILATICFAQWHVGVNFTPGLNATRIDVNSDTLTISEENKPLRLMLGLLVESELRDNYFFSTGIHFFSRKYSYKANGPQSTFDDEIVTQYIQLPATLKLHTNEIKLDMTIYFQLGASIDIPVHNNLEELDDPLITDMFFTDLSMITAAGVEYKLGTSTKAFGGLYYNRSFLNQARKTKALDGDLSMRSSLFGIQAGVIF